LARAAVGPRTSLFLDPPPSGWHGLVVTNRILRTECPWDARQTHHSLVSHLVEETYELVEAISELPAEAPGGVADFDAYIDVEEELGDVLLQVVFHATLAAEAGAFDVEEVAEGIRRKLVERHSHVFGDVDAPDADAARVNWEREKQREKGRASLMDGIISSLPALARATRIQQRAAAVGFDWPEAAPVLDKIVEEVGELRADMADPARAAEELGDLLLATVNLARHLEVDPELALRGAADRFAGRFRIVEGLAAAASRDLAEMSLEELEELWQEAKRATA
jgi:tetrapyrrole methylase family protein/MazG family protein